VTSKVGGCNGVCPLPDFFREAGKWNGNRKLWSWVQDFLMKRFARNGAFRGMEWQWAEWVEITNCYCFAEVKRT